MIEKVTDHDGRFYYRDTEGNKFSRIIAGLSFPASRPGFIIVIGEDYLEDATLKCRHLHALAEHEEQHVEGLFKKCLDLRERYQVERLIGDTGNEAVMALLYDFNKGIEGARPLSLYDASFPDDLPYHAQLIKDVTQFNNKTLHPGQCDTLRGHLSSFGPEDAQGRIKDFPAIMSLGFVLAYLKTHPARDPQTGKLQKALQDRERDYDPLNWGL
jgi:hypothetical protein